MVKRLLALAAVLVLFCLPAAATEPDPADPLADFYDAIPDPIRATLPETIFAETPDSEALQEAVSPSQLITRLRDALLGAWPTAADLLARLLLFLLFSAILTAVSDAPDSGKIGELARLIARLCGALTLLGAQLACLETLTACLRQLQALVNAVLPVLAAILAAGGNTATAVAGSRGIAVFVAVGENLCASLFLPLIAVACGLSAVAWLPSGGRLNGFARSVSRFTTWALGLFGALFSAVLAAQTMLAAGADTVAARTVKFAVGSAVPVIGGAVGDTVRTVGAALGYLKTSVGTVGMLVLVLAALPPLTELILYRAVLRLGETLADLLALPDEGRMLGEMATVAGTMLALACGALLCFLFALVLIVRVTLARGG